MQRYLKAAFWAGVSFQGLGKLPINVLAVAGFGILGFGHSSFWLLGTGLEAVFLYYLSTNARFRKVVDATDGLPDPALVDPETERENAIASFAPSARARMEKLRDKIHRALRLSKAEPSDDLVVIQNTEFLQRLESYCLKLLQAKANIESTIEEGEASKLQEKIQETEQDLAKDTLSNSLRDSKSATLEILRQRLENLSRKSETLAEIESDLTRIEAQVDLALEEASMQGRPALLSGKLDLTSQFLLSENQVIPNGPSRHASEG